MKTFSRFSFVLVARASGLTARFAAVVAAGALFVTAGFAQIAPNVQRTKIAGIDVMIYKTGVQDVVTIRGSFPAGDAHAGTGNIAIPTLTGMLLDQGTTKQDKFAIADKLEGVGATVSFGVDVQTVEIRAKTLKKDVPLVIGLIAEQLRTPAFAPEEFEKARTQFIGGLQRSLEDTDSQAADAFSRAVYPVGHPNRMSSPADFIAATKAAKLEDVKAFHAKYYGPKNFTLVLVGDVDAAVIQREIGAAFAGWTGGGDFIHPAKSTGTDAARDQTVAMPDKTSVSIVWGQPSGLRYSDPDYQAIRTATAIFGSGFTGRLMANVRDREGLTYGIGSTMAQDAFSDGEWRIVATFAPEKLEEGLASTKRQLTLWHDQGVTAQELQDRKGNLVGTFKVSLATTEGLAGALLAAKHRGYDPTWLDEYPKRVEALTLEQVNDAVKKYVKPDAMILIKAGTLPTAR